MSDTGMNSATALKSESLTCPTRENFLEYVKLGKPLCFDIQLQIFQLPNAGDIFLEHARHGWSFYDEPLNRLFRLPGAGKIIFMYVRQRKIDGVKEIVRAFRRRA